jgi:rRNA processing protein Gar1
MEGRLRVLGRVVSVSRAGYLVVKVDNPGDRGLRPGVSVLLGGRRVGRVVDLVGNVESPYALVRPAKESGLDPGGVLGAQLYYLQPRPRRPRRAGRFRGVRRGPRRVP